MRSYRGALPSSKEVRVYLGVLVNFHLLRDHISYYGSTEDTKKKTGRVPS
jgi:hypothetical protein